MRVVSLLIVCIALIAPRPLTQVVERVVANDNRIPAGKLAGGVQRVRLEVRNAIWHPDAAHDPGMLVEAFAESGKAPQIPAPLIRVAAGTRVEVSVTNRLRDKTLAVHGLFARPASTEGVPLVVAPDSTGVVHFQLTEPGTYLYWATTSDSAFGRRIKSDTQLAGAIVVDQPNTKVRDRVFVITQWGDSLDAAGAIAESSLMVAAINGKAWPHTERFNHSVRDTVRWRWVNASIAAHPMHLHGFYFRIDSRGSFHRDTVYTDATARMAVTERVPAGSTMTMAWVPEREGNWLFHCHVPLHVEPHRPLDGSAPIKASGHHTNHTLQGMGGLVLGIHVKSAVRAAPMIATSPRTLRLVAEADTGNRADLPAYRFRLDAADQRARAGIGLALNPVLVLKRGEPVAINVVNTLSEPTAVHWHGIELDSYFDGVAGFGGTGKRITPVIMPGDSFLVRFTPPRAGTFIYHTHVDERRQEPAGLSGVIVVLEPNQTFDPSTDHPVLLTSPRRGERGSFVINGSPQPRWLELQAGRRQRIRVVNMMLGPGRGMSVTLMQDSTTLVWRPLAKDGAELPAAFATLQPSVVRVSIGETHDFEVRFSEPGDYRLQVQVADNPRAPIGALPIRVR
ncbi:MAG: multicopper oxidase domain-containing protein [Gemmatimonadota bacterium]